MKFLKKNGEIAVIDDAINYLQNMKKAYNDGDITEKELTAFVFELGESLCGVEPGDERPATEIFQELLVAHKNAYQTIEELYKRTGV